LAIKLFKATSQHIASHHIASHHTTPHHTTSHHITSHHITSHHITSHHITYSQTSLSVVAVSDSGNDFESFQALQKYLQYEDKNGDPQWAKKAWDAGYHSLEAVGRVDKSVFINAHGAGIAHFHAFCRARAGKAL